MPSRPPHHLHENDHYLLTGEEVEHPEIVFRHLFDAYHISDIRQRLRDIIESALLDQNCDAQSYFYFFTHMEKLVEAALLIMTTDRSGKMAAAGDPLPYDEPDEKYYKPPAFEEIAALRPLESLEKTFRICGEQQLTAELRKWQRIVATLQLLVRNDSVPARHADDFCEALCHLVRTACGCRSGFSKSAEEDIAQFYSRFTFTYARRELWDLFSLVLNDQRTDSVPKSDALTTYRCLMSVVTATYYLLEASEHEGSAVMTTACTI